MAYEDLKRSTLPRVLTDLVGDIADLFQKEMRLARAEITSNISAKLHAGAWMAVAGVLGLIALMCAIAGLILAIASFGVALHWSCLMVAAGLGLLAGIAFAKGKSDAAEDLLPSRTLNQINKDINTAKDQFS
jgi:hypothetical protein